jgi:3-oxoacyl-[acyl-carrier protein] reductase
MLQGKTIIITGSGRGIGRATAEEMARLGANVVINDIDPEVAEETAAAIRATDGKAVAAPGSVSKMDSAKNIVKIATDTFGGLHGLVNNAGVLRDRMFWKMSEEEWDMVIDVHLRGAFCMTRAAIDVIKENGGSIVNMTSRSGLSGNQGQANYATAKLGLVGMTKTLSMELDRFGVRVNCVAPGAKTRMTMTIPEEVIREKAKTDPKYLKWLNLPGPETIAPIITWLMTDESKDITGEIFYVSGNRLGVWDHTKERKLAVAPEYWTMDLIQERMREDLFSN